MLKDEFLKIQNFEKQAKEEAYRLGKQKYSLEQQRAIASFENKLEEVVRLTDEINSIQPEVFKSWMVYYEAKLDMAKVQKKYFMVEYATKYSEQELRIFEQIYDDAIQSAENELQSHIRKVSNFLRS